MLFVLGAVGFAYDLPDLGFEIASAVFGICMAIAGTIYAAQSFKQVETEFREGWRPMPDLEGSVRNPIIFSEV